MYALIRFINRRPTRYRATVLTRPIAFRVIDLTWTESVPPRDGGLPGPITNGEVTLVSFPQNLFNKLVQLNI